MASMHGPTFLGTPVIWTRTFVHCSRQSMVLESQTRSATPTTALNRSARAAGIASVPSKAGPGAETCARIRPGRSLWMAVSRRAPGPEDRRRAAARAERRLRRPILPSSPPRCASDRARAGGQAAADRSEARRVHRPAPASTERPSELDAFTRRGASISPGFSCASHRGLAGRSRSGPTLRRSLACTGHARGPFHGVRRDRLSSPGAAR